MGLCFLLRGLVPYDPPDTDAMTSMITRFPFGFVMAFIGVCGITGYAMEYPHIYAEVKGLHGHGDAHGDDHKKEEVAPGAEEAELRAMIKAEVAKEGYLARPLLLTQTPPPPP